MHDRTIRQGDYGKLYCSQCATDRLELFIPHTLACVNSVYGLKNKSSISALVAQLWMTYATQFAGAGLELESGQWSGVRQLR